MSPESAPEPRRAKPRAAGSPAAPGSAGYTELPASRSAVFRLELLRALVPAALAALLLAARTRPRPSAEFQHQDCKLGGPSVSYVARLDGGPAFSPTADIDPDLPHECRLLRVPVLDPSRPHSLVFEQTEHPWEGGRRFDYVQRERFSFNPASAEWRRTSMERYPLYGFNPRTAFTLWPSGAGDVEWSSPDPRVSVSLKIDGNEVARAAKEGRLRVPAADRPRRHVSLLLATPYGYEAAFYVYERAPDGRWHLRTQHRGMGRDAAGSPREWDRSSGYDVDDR